MSPTLTDPVTVAAWVADRLEESQILHATGGAIALGAHGISRTTADVDISVFVRDDDLDPLFDALERGGCRFDRADARGSIAKANLFTVRCGRVDVDLFVSFHSHHHEALARRVKLRCADGEERWFLSAEDLAVHKLALFRPKDHMDLELLFVAVGAKLDIAYLRRWVHAIAGPESPRAAMLEDLVRRFGS